MLPPRDDLHFLLFDWLHAESLAERPDSSHLDRDGIEAMIDAALQRFDQRGRSVRGGIAGGQIGNQAFAAFGAQAVEQRVNAGGHRVGK